jgi:hypothetical protein
MENINENPVVEENTEAPIIEETPEVIETPAVEEPVVAEQPAVEESILEPEAHEEAPTAINTSDFGKSDSEQQAVGQLDSGAIGVTAAPVLPKSSKKSKIDINPEETVAIRSTKNVSWPEVGKVYFGINIVAKSAAEKWLTRSHISLATPEEVAKEFGK